VFRAQAPLAAVPRPRTRLGTRLALVLLPLVALPLVLMGTAAYVRSRTILRDQAVSQLSSAAQDQAQALRSWALVREQFLQLGSQRAALRANLATMMRSTPANPAYRQARGALQEGLRELLARESQVLFSAVVLARLPDGLIVGASDSSMEGATLAAIANGALSTSTLETRPVFDDPLLAPGNLVFLTSAPILAPESGTPDALLVGVNRDLRVAQLIEQLQVLWQDRGAYRVEVGDAFLAVPPDALIRVERYSTSPVSAHEPHLVFGLAGKAVTGSFSTVESDGVAALGAYEWLPDWNLGVVLELPEATVFAELNSLAPFMIGLVGLAVIVSTGMVLYVTARMLRPLGNLTQFSERISRGEWSHRVPEERQDELGTLAGSLNRMAEELSGLYRSLEARVEERTRQIRTAAEVARAVTSTPQLDDLLRRAVDLIRERFGFYHVSIFLLDHAGKVATLRESTGQVGAVLKARGHSLAVGSQSVIGWVTANNQPRIASDVGRDPVHLANELLPETESEAAVPLQVAGRVLGALDVQSAEPGAFTPEMIEILQTLADQLSAAIQNARLAQESAQAADRSRLISEVSSQFSGLMDIERVLETAAHTLHRVLGQPEVVIQLTPPGTVPPNGDEAGA
jgi:HAMP domain-containing protein